MAGPERRGRRDRSWRTTWPSSGRCRCALVGYAITAVLALVVALAILRDPRPRTLILGLAATTLIAFSFLTSMHERYAFGVVGFLMLLVPDRTVRALAIAFAIVFTANLLAAAPPTPQIAALLPIDGWLGIAGSVAILALTVAMMRLTGVGQPPRSDRTGSRVRSRPSHAVIGTSRSGRLPSE